MYNSETVNKSYGYTGKGTATYPNGDIYEGQFVEGVIIFFITTNIQVREGEEAGTYKYFSKPAEDGTAPENKYTGSWKGNNKHGIGKMVYAGVGVYYGYWANGLREGEGVMTYSNQDVYSGMWKDGKKHAQGTYVFFQTGMKFVGKWSNGQIVNGEWRYPNGTRFEGNFDNNKPKGKGKWQFSNGNVVEGLYTQTKIAEQVKDDIKLTWKTTSDITAIAQ